MVWFPADKALMFASGISAYPASDAPFQIPSPGMNGKPVPVAPTVSMKPSAALTVEPELVMLAVTRTTGWLELRAPAPLFGLGVALTAEVTGPPATTSVSYTHLRAHETDSYIVCRLLLEKKK